MAGLHNHIMQNMNFVHKWDNDIENYGFFKMQKGIESKQISFEGDSSF